MRLLPLTSFPPPARRAALLALTVALALLAPACSGSAGGSDDVVQLSFSESIDLVAATGEAPESARREAEHIVATVTDWYQEAFVDPSGWKDPEFPAVVRLFSGPARAQAQREIGSLSIGGGRDDVRSVRPDKAEIKVTLYVDAGGSPTYAISSVAFQGTGRLKKEGLPLTIVQSGVYYWRLEDAGWRIFAYQARGDQAQNPPKPSLGAA